MISSPRFLFVLVVLIMGGCTPLVKAEQPVHTTGFQLESGEMAGQTFISRYAGLQGVALHLIPGEPGQGELRLHLRASSDADTDLAVSSLPLSAVDSAGFYRFVFPSVEGSQRQDYFFLLELNGNGSVRLGSGHGEAYLNGALYRNGSPVDGQLAFRLVHDPARVAAGLAGEGLTWLAWLVVAGLLFILPGWGLLAALLPGWPALSYGERAGLAAGASLALYPLLFLWTDLAGLRLGALYAWLPVLGGFVLVLVYSFKPARSMRKDGRQKKKALPDRPASIFRPSLSPSTAFAADATLLIVLALIFAVRFWAIRDLDLPMWGDSVQHTMISQLLVDRGGLFREWAPYAELQTFTYHFGFHTLVAALHWVTQLPIPQATLVTGQILNGLAVLALYPLAARLGSNRWSGVVAVLLAGLLAPMPMYYLNWGRYTELAGLAILPTAVYLTSLFLQEDRIGDTGGKTTDDRRRTAERRRKPSSLVHRLSILSVIRGLTASSRLAILASVVLGGLALTHYRVLLFAVMLFPTVLLFNLHRSRLRSFLERTLLVGAGAGLLFLPWLGRLFSGRLLQVFGDLATTAPQQLPAAVMEANAIGDLTTYLPVWIWLLGLLAIGWSLWLRERQAVLFGLWWCAILLAANPDLLGLPGTGILSNFAVFIAAYFPAGVLVGAAAGWGIARLSDNRNRVKHWARRNGSKRLNGALKRISIEALAGQPAESGKSGLQTTAVPAAKTIQARPAFSPEKSDRFQPGFSLLQLALLLAVVGLSLWGARLRLTEVDIRQHALAARPDLRAFTWIQSETPQTAHFLVNSFPAYGDTLTVGSDGGWWLPLLAGRASTLPPINYSSERGPRPDYLAWVNALTFSIREKGPNHPEVLDMLRRRAVTHVFIGQRQGTVGAGAQPLLPVEQLLGSPYYRVVYQQDRVWIFEIVFPSE